LSTFLPTELAAHAVTLGVPDVARRLGIVKLTTQEIDWEIRELSDYELRVRTLPAPVCAARQTSPIME
jgi:hypothetical protein